MTPDEYRSPRILRFARWYVRRAVARELDGLHAGGLDETRAVLRDQPVILAANHVAWWDAFLLVALDAVLGSEGYALMDAENLCRIPFFARLGAIPLDRAQPRAALRAAAALLRHRGRAVWIFPQGSHRPAHLRPLAFQPGVRLLARLAPEAAVVPVAFQYAFGEGHHPAAYVRFGAPLAAAAVAGEGGVEQLESAVARELARIDDSLAGWSPPLPTIIASRGQRPDSGVGTRLLNRMLDPRRADANG